MKSKDVSRGRGKGRSRGKGRMPGPTTRKPAGNQQPESFNAHDSKNCRFFNMCTYKLHALGHYIAAIVRFGTTDSYSTQVVFHGIIFLAYC